MGLASFNRMRRRQAAIKAEMRSEKGLNPNDLTRDELRVVAKELGLEGYYNLKKAELLELVVKASASGADDKGSGSNESGENTK